SPPGLAAEMRISQEEDFARATDLGESRWIAKVESKSRFEAGLRVVLAPDGSLSVSTAGAPSVSARASLSLESESGTPVRLLGLAGGTRIEAHEVDISVNVAGPAPESPLQVSAHMSPAALVIAPRQGDAFLSSLLPAEGIRADFDLGMDWSIARGLTFRGSGSLDATLPTALAIG